MNRPIGIFDSGVGGTSIWKEIHQLMPNEQTIYLADSKNAPYGKKSKEALLQLCIKNTEYLLNEGCKIIVVACNTATTNAIDYLRENYKIPFIGIEPAIKPAALHSKTKRIGVLATKGTLSSKLFYNTSKLHTQEIQIMEREGTGLVELIEAGRLESKETSNLLREYVNPMLHANIDCLVLGCTHYPYLIPILRKFLPDTVQIIDSGEAVARQTKAVLLANNLQNMQTNSKIKNRFYSNTATGVLKKLVGEGMHEIYHLDF